MEADGSRRIVTVFRSRLRPDAAALGYPELASRMEARARSMPGFVEFKAFTAPDGERVSIIVFDTVDHQAAWRHDVDHRLAQRRGRAEFYTEYSISVCEELSFRSFRSPHGEVATFDSNEISGSTAHDLVRKSDLAEVNPVPEEGDSFAT